MEQDKNMKDGVYKLVAERVNKTLEKFHEYLGGTFYSLLPSNKGDGLYELRSKQRIHIVKIDEVKDKLYQPIDLMDKMSGFAVYILFRLIKNQIYNEDVDKRGKKGIELWIAGLPFNFLIESFVEEYLGNTSAIRLKEILNLMGIKKSTYDPYFSHRVGEFRDVDLPELIADIFDKEDSDTLTVNHVRVALGIDPNYLIDYINDGYDEQFILTDNGKKIYFQKSTK